MAPHPRLAHTPYSRLSYLHCRPPLPLDAPQAATTALLRREAEAAAAAEAERRGHLLDVARAQRDVYGEVRSEAELAAMTPKRRLAWQRRARKRAPRYAEARGS